MYSGTVGVEGISGTEEDAELLAEDSATLLELELLGLLAVELLLGLLAGLLLEGLLLEGLLLAAGLLLLAELESGL